MARPRKGAKTFTRKLVSMNGTVYTAIPMKILNSAPSQFSLKLSVDKTRKIVEVRLDEETKSRIRKNI